MLQALSTSILTPNWRISSGPNLPGTNWHAEVAHPKGLSSNLSKRTGRSKLLNPIEIILKSPEKFVRCEVPSMICHEPPAETETNWLEQLAHTQGLDRNLGKRTGRSKLLNPIEIILKSPEMSVRCEVPSMICHEPPAETATNWHEQLAHTQGLDRNLGKRTGRPNPLNPTEIILRTTEMFVRLRGFPSMICHETGSD